MDWRRCLDALWFLTWAAASSIWCLTAATAIGPTFDEPTYLENGLQGWREFSHSGLLRMGTMPLAIDVQTLPLYLWEVSNGTPIDAQSHPSEYLVWMRAGNLAFWLLLLRYGCAIGRHLAGPWGGRLAVAYLACEPNLLAHAALATTDVALTACLLALIYHFRVGRDAGWMRRVMVPAIWFGLAIVAKASAIVYGPICLVVVEVERLARQSSTQSVESKWTKCWRDSVRDFMWIGAIGMLVAVIYCGSDFEPQPGFQRWAVSLQEGVIGSCMAWLADNLRIFSNAFEGIVRQVKHNMHGHGTFLLGEVHAHSLWYYFPVLLTIKLSAPIMLAPLVVLLAGRARALANWACLTALVLLAFSLTFRVQIGVRLVLPLIAIGTIGMTAAMVETVRASRWQWARAILISGVASGLFWIMTSAIQIWPHGLCYVNELWGGTEHGYKLVSDSNYDWGQGLPELLAWQKNNGADVDVWYFGRDERRKLPPLREVPLHVMKIDEPQDVVNIIQARYLAVGTTLIYGQATTLASHRNAAEFLLQCEPVARTTTFLIFEREALALESQRLTRLTPPPPRKAT